MTFDPTTNRVQWYLLTDEEKAAIKAWPHGWEIINRDDGTDEVKPLLNGRSIYRGKPAPAVTSTWQNIYPTCSKYTSRAQADKYADPYRIAVLRRDTINGVTTAHLEDV